MIAPPLVALCFAALPPSLSAVPNATTLAPNQAIQLIGAAMILLAYLFLHLGKTAPRKSSYLLPNCLGAGLLAVEAARTGQYGFLALEGTWSLISGIVWLRVLLTQTPSASSISTEPPGKGA